MTPWRSAAARMLSPWRTVKCFPLLLMLTANFFKPFSNRGGTFSPINRRCGRLAPVLLKGEIPRESVHQPGAG